MNAIRRILLALYSLVLLAALAGAGALAWNQDEKLDLDIDGKLNIQAFIDSTNTAKWALTGVLAGLALLALITLLIAIWPRRENRGPLRIRQSEGGIVEVTPAAIESVLRDELESLPEVRRATPKVRIAGGAIDTYLDAEIEPSVSIAQATRLLSSTTDQVLKEHVGATAARRPTIRISYQEMNARPVRDQRRPAFSEGSPTAAQPNLAPQHEARDADAGYPQDPSAGQRYDAVQDEAPLTNDGR